MPALLFLRFSGGGQRRKGRAKIRPDPDEAKAHRRGGEKHGKNYRSVGNTRVVIASYSNEKSHLS